MSAHALIPEPHMSVEEYLNTTFDGADREYLDGEVVERNMGNKSHGRSQLEIAAALKSHEKRTGIFVVVEVRSRVTRTRYRIPDVAVYSTEPAEEVPGDPPLVAIEVLSPGDRIGYIIPKLIEYRSWRVRHIWLADPERRKLFIYAADGLHEVTEFVLAEHAITLTAAEIFGA